MEIELLLRSLYALSVICVLLFILWWCARVLGQKRIVTGIDHRLVTVIETTYLSQQSMMHVVRIGARYFAIGGGSTGLTLITELETAPLDAWVENKRSQVEEQRASVGALLNRFRKNG
jgi:flagellar biogenesis protein FliO